MLKLVSRLKFERLALRNTMLRQASPEIACSKWDPASPNSFYVFHSFSIMSCELGNFLRSRSRSHNHVIFAGYLQWTLCFLIKNWSLVLQGFSCDFSNACDLRFRSPCVQIRPAYVAVRTHRSFLRVRGPKRSSSADLSSFKDSWCILLAVGRDG